MERLIRARTARRRAIAIERAERALTALARDGHDAVVIGSLASGRFSAHSDLDVLVRSPVDRKARAGAERTVADVMRGSGVPYDLIFARDLTRSQQEELEQVFVDASGLRQARAETGESASGTRPPR